MIETESSALERLSETDLLWRDGTDVVSFPLRVALLTLLLLLLLSLSLSLLLLLLLFQIDILVSSIIFSRVSCVCVCV